MLKLINVYQVSPNNNPHDYRYIVGGVAMVSLFFLGILFYRKKNKEKNGFKK